MTLSTRYSTMRRAGATALVVALPLALAACNRGGSTSSGGGKGKDVRIAIVTRDFTNPYWAALRDGAIAEGKKQGVAVTVQAGSTETDSTGENAKISTLAGQDYNCFGVVPVNATNVITPLVPVAQEEDSDPQPRHPDRCLSLEGRRRLVRLVHRLGQSVGRPARRRRPDGQGMGGTVTWRCCRESQASRTESTATRASPTSPAAS